MPVTTADQRAASGSVSSPSSTAIPCRRLDYVHVLLLVEQFRPIPSLPVNTRVIAQTESPIDLTLASDDDTFLSSVDYSILPKYLDSPLTSPPALDEEKTATPHSPHIRVARLALLSGLQSLLALIRRHYGAASSLHADTAQPHHYPVRLQTLANLANPVNPAGDSTYHVVHHLVRRPLSTQGKTQEAVHKVAHVQARPALHALRLDYLALNEATVPRELFELGDAARVTDVNLGFNHFLYFPPGLCAAFTGLRELTMAGNREIFHIPAEVGTLKALEVLDLTDCSNLVSLPLTLPQLTRLTRLHLFGCVNLAFPPHAVAVRAQLATQETPSEAGVKGVLDYIRNPLSWLSFNLNEAKKAMASRIARAEVYAPVRLQVLSYRKAYAGNYVEYELSIETHGRQWGVWRRFSQFTALVDELERWMPAGEWEKLAKLPGKTWSLHEEDGERCEERRKAMDALCEGLRQFEERNEEARHAAVAKEGGKGKGKGGQVVKGLNEMPFVRTFFEVDAHVDI